MSRLTDKVAFITGAARGIGRGIALSLAEAGADIAINDLAASPEAQKTAEAVEKLGRRALICPADVADRDALAQSFDQAVEHFGHINVVIANAALSVREPFLDASWPDAKRTMEVTQFGVFHTCQLAAQHMVKQQKEETSSESSRGKILIIGSVHYVTAVPNCTAYNMAKAAINHLAHTLAVELAPHRINVNVINPGWIDTPGERQFASEEAIAKGGELIPWQRLGTASDIGKAAAFLVSDDAEYITGASLLVDGGYIAGLGLRK